MKAPVPLLHPESQWLSLSITDPDLSALRVSFHCPVHGAQRNALVGELRQVTTCTPTTIRGFCERCEDYWPVAVRFDLRLVAEADLYRCAVCKAPIGIDDSKVCETCYQRGAR